jgi:hypothetical protein
MWGERSGNNVHEHMRTGIFVQELHVKGGMCFVQFLGMDRMFRKCTICAGTHGQGLTLQERLVQRNAFDGNIGARDYLNI